MAYHDHGYEDGRFESAVNQNFYCAICANVLKDPAMCRQNQHCFCRPCIYKHLENSHTCPSCREWLTLETLSKPPRILTSYLAELRIRCDFFERGCLEFVELGYLESHAKNCDFAPVKCSNEGCDAEINKRDRILHETMVCDFRKFKCHNCHKMRSKVNEMERSLMALNGKLDEMAGDLMEIRGQVGNLTTLPIQMRSIRTAQQEMMSEVRGMITEVREEIKNVQSRAIDQRPSTTKKGERIVVAGGTCPYAKNRDLPDSVEMYSMSQKTWVQLDSLNERRRMGAASFVYGNQIIVSGGRDSLYEGDCSDTMEGLTVNNVHSSQWRQFPSRLPFKCYGHKSVVLPDDRLIVIGGSTGQAKFDATSFSDGIFEVLLAPPYTSRLLTKLPKPVYFHGVELINNKIFIFGGIHRQFCFHSASMDVFMYDISKNECRQVHRLPYGVGQMGSVCWGGNFIVVGGTGESGKPLSNVFMYNIETGKSHMLPPMKERRKMCSAVLVNHQMVVMGGQTKSFAGLSSVECFNFNRYAWEVLPPMNEARELATAVTW